jgi:hypothetical protein
LYQPCSNSDFSSGTAAVTDMAGVGEQQCFEVSMARSASATSHAGFAEQPEVRSRPWRLSAPHTAAYRFIDAPTAD